MFTVMTLGRVRRHLECCCVSLALLAGLAACSQLPVVSVPTISNPGSSFNLQQATVIQQDGVMSPADGLAKIRETQSEGKRHLLAHHLGLLTQLGEATTADNDVKLLIDGPATYSAMLADLTAARTSIQMESYIFEDAAMGVRIAQTLKQKAASGIPVHLIYDAFGSLNTPRAFFDEMAQAGVAVCQFNPINPLGGRLNNRDHRKILIVDSRVAFTGGINISGVYSVGSSAFRKDPPRKDFPPDASAHEAETPAEKGWRDTHIRVQGPAVADFSTLFVDTWERQKCADPPAQIQRQNTPEHGDRLMAVLGSKPGDAEPRIYRTLLTAIGGAKRSVHITMSYFVPDPQTVSFLTAAARRGVAVKLILQGKSDSQLVLRAGQSHYQTLLDAGVELYERNDTLLHTKAAVIDGVWSTVGSSNVDWRSFLHNDEVSVIVLGADFGAEMEQLFQADLARSHRLTAEAWEERGLSRRLMEWLGRMFEYWL